MGSLRHGLPALIGVSRRSVPSRSRCESEWPSDWQRDLLLSRHRFANLSAPPRLRASAPRFTPADAAELPCMTLTTVTALPSSSVSPPSRGDRSRRARRRPSRSALCARLVNAPRVHAGTESTTEPVPVAAAVITTRTLRSSAFECMNVMSYRKSRIGSRSCLRGMHSAHAPRFAARY
jgi:hypothetical protein